jgi:hypothetical protein
MVLAEALCRLAVAQWHPDADGERRRQVVPALGALHHPRAVWALRDLRMVVLHAGSCVSPERRNHSEPSEKVEM